ncbi:nickel pincer cofactor biosynthesis protein LarB [Nocardioides zeae]|uniref:Nickel pincer cofactor biosynthesis protein LarB n=1 Tax=Nocardioides imazamoxiresistens TaxID=3231893 RepID=A0ABU3PZ94_9ACTN|nr:nickel pincer cofactor biosynthesis protein LarB [Nocardioides zeae]MDT9594090.1 nickel pincer cofactor biosynthesis protein LarB [Nocardioides zeae]
MSATVPAGSSGYEDLGYARVDTHRQARQGVPEVVYGPGKRPEQVVGIVRTLLEANTGPVLVTRIDAEAAATVLAAVPDGAYDASARVCTWRPAPTDRGTRVAVVTAGTSDGPVADEVVAVASAIGLEVIDVRDVGVAAIHRLLDTLPLIETADVVVAVAGMEGALASVLGGLVAAPVVAVPTSTGYGAALDGMTALLAMTTSCAAGLTVVNIDGGFSAAMAAHRIATSYARRAARETP